MASIENLEKQVQDIPVNKLIERLKQLIPPQAIPGMSGNARRGIIRSLDNCLDKIKVNYHRDVTMQSFKTDFPMHYRRLLNNTYYLVNFYCPFSAP